MTSQTKQPQKFSKWVIALGIAAIILLIVFPLMTMKGSAFGGSDDAGSAVIAQIAPNYNSKWIANVWTPPGGETESMLFALQAAAGGICIGYFFGYVQGRKKGQEQAAPASAASTDEDSA
jgi:cobalt/nickel transport protein